MSQRTLIAISFCADHWKGSDPGRGTRLPGEEHWTWLEECVDYLTATEGLPIVVCCTGWRGIVNVTAADDDHSRDVAWRVLAKTRAIIGVPDNPGHQIGAALCIRQGLEAASKLGYDYLIHTAEDVVPGRGCIRNMVSDMAAGRSDYVSEEWCSQQLNTQFFGCRVNTLVGPWDHAAVPAYGCVERYAFELLKHRPYWFMTGLYRSTHDHSTWNQWARENVS